MKLMLLFFIFWNIQSGKAIIGGKEVIPNQYPWVLKLNVYFEQWEVNCGASLISKKFALTAAHCVSQVASELILFWQHGISDAEVSIKNMEVTAGEHSLIENENSQKRIKICKFKIHPLYHQAKYVDLAILEFCNPVEFNENIQPIELVPPKLNIWKDGRPNVTIAGWGRMENNTFPSKLRAVTQQIKTVNNIYNKSNQIWQDFRNGICEAFEFVLCSLYARICEDFEFVPCSLYARPSFIKTVLLTYDYFGSGTDYGDSGGPIWWKDAETLKIYQVGVTSGGVPIDDKLLSRICYYDAVNESYQWIMDNI